MIPVEQRCPSCGRKFMGSDAIGDKCLECKINESNIDQCDCPDGKCILCNCNQKSEEKENKHDKR